jgi:hypothetical protein
MLNVQEHLEMTTLMAHATGPTAAELVGLPALQGCLAEVCRTVSMD